MARHDHRDVSSSDATAARSVSEAQPGARARAQVAAEMRAEARIDLRDLTVDRTGEIPIGVQLAWALRARIGDGRLAPGQRLPGLRELAETLGINANTARAVYQRLEQEGLIDSRQGTGTFVASIAQEPSAVGQIAADAALQARRTGVDPRAVAAALYVTPGAPSDFTRRRANDGQTLPASPSVQPTDASAPNHDTPAEAAATSTRVAERRRELRSQIAALEQTLSEIQARHPSLIAPPPAQVRDSGPRLLSAEELERVRTQLVRRLAAAEPLLDTPAQSMQAAVREREEHARAATTRDADPKRVESSLAKKPTRPRARTRPSTA